MKSRRLRVLITAQAFTTTTLLLLDLPVIGFPAVVKHVNKRTELSCLNVIGGSKDVSE